jgi:hypothetical protein
MNIARAFSYTRTVERALENASERAEGLAAQLETSRAETSIEHARAAAAEAVTEILTAQIAGDSGYHEKEVNQLYREIRSLRKTNAALVDRRALREGIIPPTESLTRPKPTEEEAAERSKTVESIRRSGPVAKTRTDAEAEYLANPEAYIEAHSD